MIISKWTQLRLGRVGCVSSYGNVVLLDPVSQCKTCNEVHQPKGSGTSIDVINAIAFMSDADHPSQRLLWLQICTPVYNLPASLLNRHRQSSSMIFTSILRSRSIYATPPHP